MNKNKLKNIIIVSLILCNLSLLNRTKIQKEQINKAQKLYKSQQQIIYETKSKLSRIETQLNIKKQRISKIESINSELYKNIDKLKNKDLIDIGSFQITNYTLSPSECSWAPGHKNYGVTASGKKAIDGVTVATDWSILPKGTKIYIEGIGVREVQDTGNLVKGNVIDVFVGDPQVDRSSQSRAKTFGRQVRKVWVVHETR